MTARVTRVWWKVDFISGRSKMIMAHKLPMKPRTLTTGIVIDSSISCVQVFTGDSTQEQLDMCKVSTFEYLQYGPSATESLAPLRT
jgi:hypothetical protein